MSAATTIAVIYNCKPCKTARRVEYTRKPNVWNKNLLVRTDGSGNQVTSGVWIERCGGGKPTVYGGDPLGVCSGCGKAMTYGQLTASLRPEVKCNAVCQHARGFSCDCSCNGKNHGMGWGVGAPSFTSMVAA